MRPGVRPWAPGVVWSLAIETSNREGGTRHRSIISTFKRAAVVRSIYRRGKWSSVDVWDCPTPEAVRECMSDYAVRGRTNWVVPLDAQAALTLTQWWDYAQTVGLVIADRSDTGKRPSHAQASDDKVYVTNAVVRTGTTVLSYHQSRVAWRWVSLSQYDPSRGVDSWAGSPPGAGVGSEAPPGGEGGDDPLSQRATTYIRTFTRLCDWWRSAARAPFGVTVGQLSVGMLRSYIAPKLLCSHNDGDCHALERSAAFGGRASVWYCGRTSDILPRPDGLGGDDSGAERHRASGAIVHVDVRSMYPTLLRDMQYPVKLKSYQTNVPVSDLLDLSRYFATIARVTIRTKVPEYPYRSGDRVTYPVGQFVTTLVGPELLKCSQDSEIIACHEMSMYNVGRPFEGAAAALLDMRARLDASGDRDGSTFAKLLANSLGGKLAQRMGGWSRWRDEDTPGQWGEEWRYDVGEKTRTRVRYLAGMAWRWVDDKVGRGPYTFAFAYLAAYGRLMMRQFRELCPARSVLSQDTDGMWLLAPALDALADAGEPSGDGPGCLRITQRATEGQFYGPRHYCIDGVWTLAGFHQPFVSDDGTKVHDIQEQTIWTMRSQSAPAEIVKHVRTSHLTAQDVGGDVGPDGWVVPRPAKRFSLPTNDRSGVEG